MGPKPLFRPACVQLQLIYRNSTVDIMALLCLVSKTGFLKKAEMWLTLYFLIPMSLWEVEDSWGAQIKISVLLVHSRRL